MNFLETLKKRIMILDGGIGSQFFKKLPDYNGCIEMLNFSHPEIVKQVHSEYIQAGADIIETNTFGGSVIKLSEYNDGDKCYEINKQAAEIAISAVTSNQYVAGSIGPSGILMEPMGEYTYDQVYGSFREQAVGLMEGGVDLIVIETMSDLQEAKTAINAVKQNTGLPVICNMTFDKNGKTLSGTGLVAALSALKQHGADIVGTNCGLGPDEIYELLERHASEILDLEIPLAVWANAGLPEIKDGKTVYSQTPDHFAETNLKLAKLGINVIGGCCGTNPDHIRALKSVLAETIPVERKYSKEFKYSVSNLKNVKMDGASFLKIGERLNPTARKAFAAELKEGNSYFLRKESVLQQNEGADILDINVGVPGIDEISSMKKSVMTLTSLVNTPLMIDSDNPDVIEEALKLYPGIPVVNSINGKESSIRKILPIIQKYGCYILALCLDETGIHIDSNIRISIGDILIKKLTSAGIDRTRIIIDPLMLTESAEPGAAFETLKVIRHFSSENIKTSIGLSNISFGLPERRHVNNVFLKLAIENGLTMGIVNTNTLEFINEYSTVEQLAYNFLAGKDQMATEYIKYCTSRSNTKQPAENTQKLPDKTSPLEKIRDLIIHGNTDEIEEAVKINLDSFPAESIMNDALLKGLETVGDYYSCGKYFLPQMIASANAMKKGFTILKPFLTAKSEKVTGTVVICTVEGDVHDIGKNIVAMMFENHGFRVYDLGKDVKNSDILKKAQEVEAQIVCLSSLLTTTMPKMKDFSELLKTENSHMKLMVGGAVVTEEYARSINAFYSKDAVEAVSKAKTILSA
ncbi:MAG: homocysteine S-methyltransferase family protein [Spirochaetes bacterium]|nr:homocysteine S-methyltransferase family protein [Spirochaetota bacterium]